MVSLETKEIWFRGIFHYYLADLKQEPERSEIQQGAQKSALQLSISQRDEHNGFPALVRAVRRHLDFERWGFRIVH